MSPRLTLSPFRTHYFFSATVVLATLAWFLTFVSQAIATAQFGNRTVGVLWFAIFLQAFINIGVVLAIATDSVPAMRLQLSVFGAIAIVFSVQGVEAGIFAPQPALTAMGAGYILCAFVDILWVLYFTSEEDSLAMYLFNRMTKGGAGGGLSSARRRRVVRGIGSPAPYSMDKEAGANEMEANIPRSAMSNGNGNANIYNAHTRRMSSSPAPPATPAPAPGPATLKRSNTGTRSVSSRKNLSAASGADHVRSPSSATIKAAGAGEDPKTGEEDTETLPLPRARALHAYHGSPDDPEELSFKKGEVLEIEDQQGKWWQAKKSDGTLGIVPSNYLVLL
ncbi:hypothetical protein C8F01DRAFT_993822 [Mycena amicta]|nr:hypothetical protein C8F01DRAFT_993822 [Mycena amicta]